MHKIFVYGSLLSGMGNHVIIEKAKKLGTCKSPIGFEMIDLGYFPGALHTGNHDSSLIGEVYEVDDYTFSRVNMLEGYNSMNPTSGLYDRTLIATDFGPAYIYLYNRFNADYHSRLVANGDWRTHHNNKYKVRHE